MWRWHERLGRCCSTCISCGEMPRHAPAVRCVQSNELLSNSAALGCRCCWACSSAVLPGAPPAAVGTSNLTAASHLASICLQCQHHAQLVLESIPSRLNGNSATHLAASASSTTVACSKNQSTVTLLCIHSIHFGACRQQSKCHLSSASKYCLTQLQANQLHLL